MPDGQPVDRPLSGGSTGRTARRVLFMAAIVFVALWAAWDAAIAATATRNPATAMRLTSTNGVVIGKAFDAAFLAKGARIDRRLWRERALDSLREEPLNASGLRILATVGELDGAGIAPTARVMKLAERVSRRDGMTQLWLIEYAVQQQDVATALRHYNRVLSTRPALGTAMIPILSQAIKQPEVRRELIPYLRAERPWSTTFLLHAVDHTRDADALVQLFQAYGGARANVGHRPIEQALLARLVRDNRFDLAAAYAGKMVPVAGLSVFEISAATRDARAGPFAWVAYAGTDGDVQFDGDEVVASIRPNATVVILSRLVSLSPGRWTLIQRASAGAGANTPDLRWTASCARRSGLQQFWTGARSANEFVPVSRWSFTVPTDCGIVRFDLVGSGADSERNSAVNLSRIDLRRS